MTDYRTDLSKVRGLGAAKKGVGTYMAQRVSAVALAALLPFFVYGLLCALPDGYDGLKAWVSSWSGALLIAGFITAALYHGRLGVAEIINDYIPRPGARAFWLLINTLLALFVWALGLFALLKIWLGA